MNKLEANLSLIIITFFAGIQYAFLANVPSGVSAFAFLFVTNLFGFLFTFAFFFRELFRLDKRQLLQSIFLAAELFGFNLFLLLGSGGLSASVTSCIVAAYFVFVPMFMLLFRQKVSRNSLIGAAVVIGGLFLALKIDLSDFLNIHVLYLLVADICFALYLVNVGKYCTKANPSILAMGQMFFGFLFALTAWIVQALLTGADLKLPGDADFWSGVVFISFFIRGLYSVVQIYAQRYVSALNVALIFSTELVFTIFMSPVLSLLFGFPAENLTLFKVAGCAIIVVGVLIADGSIFSILKSNLVICQ